jgi:hypothetical protein
MPEPGDILGAYTLHERINSGGQSEIWLATDAEHVAVRLHGPATVQHRL